jgi:hypothetical protein
MRHREGTGSPGYNQSRNRKEGARTKRANYYEAHRKTYWEKCQAGLELQRLVTIVLAEGGCGSPRTQAPRTRASP